MKILPPKEFLAYVRQSLFTHWEEFEPVERMDLYMHSRGSFAIFFVYLQTDFWCLQGDNGPLIWSIWRYVHPGVRERMEEIFADVRLAPHEEIEVITRITKMSAHELGNLLCE